MNLDLIAVQDFLSEFAVCVTPFVSVAIVGSLTFRLVPPAIAWFRDSLNG